MRLVMRVKDYFAVEVDCCLDVGCYTEKCLMDNFKRINSSCLTAIILETGFGGMS